MKKELIIFIISFCLAYMVCSLILKANNQVPMPMKDAALIWWEDDTLDFDNPHDWPAVLKQGFARHGYRLHVRDENHLDTSDIVLIAAPLFPLHKIKKEAAVYIWALESPLMLSQPFPSILEDRAKKIITWRRDLVDGQKKVYLPPETFLTDPVLPPNPEPKTIFLSQIAGNHTYHVGAEKYEDRRLSAKWWITNHPDDFELYGKDWEEIRPHLSAPDRVQFDKRYKGYVADKQTVVRRSKFVLAYENAYHNDYVSEKIYDVMKGGAVPIYRGAPNITDFVPQACFINRADFPSEQALYDYLKNMTPKGYKGYLDCIDTFLKNRPPSAPTQAQLGHFIIQTLFDE